MDAAEQYVSTLDMCRVCGGIVTKGELSECADPACGLRFCINCDCPCPVRDTAEDAPPIPGTARS